MEQLDSKVNIAIGVLIPQHESGLSATTFQQQPLRVRLEKLASAVALQLHRQQQEILRLAA